MYLITCFILCLSFACKGDNFLRNIVVPILAIFG